jgi:hypothetical protein
MPMRYYTRAETEVGGNSAITLTARAYYDVTAGVLKSTVVNTLSGDQLGNVGS